MALLLPKSVFIHIPKTGGQWVRAAIANAGIPTIESRCKWHKGRYSPVTLLNGQGKNWRHTCYHATFEQTDCSNRFSFAFVRHPIGYYRSYWSYKMSVGWDPTSRFDSSVSDESFQKFSEKVLQFHQGRGWVSMIFTSSMDRPDGKAISFVGKMEQLADDLVEALKQAGETFNEDALRSTPPVNVYGRDETRQWDFHLSDDTHRKIIASEENALKRFHYGSFTPQRV